MSVIGEEVSRGRGVVRGGGAEERADISASSGWAEGSFGVGGSELGGRSVAECSREEPREDEPVTKLGRRGSVEAPFAWPLVLLLDGPGRS